MKNSWFKRAISVVTVTATVMGGVVTIPAATNAEEEFPAQFDLREEGYVTPVKFQNPWQACWAFSGTAAAESSILSLLGMTNEQYKEAYGGEDFDQKILVLRLLVTQCDGQFDRFPDFKTLAARATGTEESYDGEDDFADFDSKDGTSSLTTGSDFDNYALEEESLFDADAQDESKTETEVSDSNTPMETSDIPDIPIFQERTQSNGAADAPTAASRDSTLE